MPQLHRGLGFPVLEQNGVEPKLVGMHNQNYITYFGIPLNSQIISIAMA